MRIYLIRFFLISIITNTLFQFAFTSMGGEMNVNLLVFLGTSFSYMFPYTIVNFILTGIISCFFIKKIIENKLVAIFPLFFLIFLDISIFKQFYNTFDLSMILIRIGFVLMSYLLLYFNIRWMIFKGKIPLRQG